MPTQLDAIDLKGQIPSSVTAPTASVGDNDTSIATTAFVQNELNATEKFFSSEFGGDGSGGNPINITDSLATKQDDITLTTTGTSGPATFVGATLNIPQYSGGSQTPWTVDINADQHTLTDLKSLTVQVVGSGTPATYNPSDKDPIWTLSGGNLIATASSGNYGVARATVGKSTGNFSVTFTITNGGNIRIGLAKLTTPLNGILGNDTDSYCYNSDGNKQNNSVNAVYGATYTTGDVITMTYSSGTLSFSKNGTPQGTAYTGLTGTFYPAISSFFSSAVITADFSSWSPITPTIDLLKTTTELVEINKIIVNGNKDTGSPDAAVKISRTISGILDAHGFADYTLYTATDSYASFDGVATISNAGATDHHAPFQARPIINKPSGSLAKLYGFVNIPTITTPVATVYGHYDWLLNASSTVTDYMAIRMQTPLNQVTNQWGIWYDAPSASGQNWGIYDNGGNKFYQQKIIAGSAATNDASAAISINSTTQGFQLPRMTKVQRNAISSPGIGLAIFQTDNIPGLRVYNGTNWIKYTETID